MAPTEKSGFLQKRGEINTNFQNRWFVLRARKLFYFEQQKDSSPKGTIDLPGARLYMEAPNEIKIACPTRMYVLKAQTVAERDEWIKALCSQGCSM